MNKLDIKIVVVALLTCLANAATAQKFTSEWVLVELGGGLHNIQFKPNNGEHKMGAGLMLDAKYMRHLNQQWSVNGGLGFANYSSCVEFNTMEQTEKFDNENERTYELQTEYNNFIEKQKLYQLEIPIGATYRLNKLFTYTNLHIGAGVKFGIPIISKYMLKDGEYKVSGYYPSIDVTFEDMEEHDFYTVEASKQKDKVEISGFNVSIYLDALLHRHLNLTTEAYAGLYFSYCPLNITKKSDAPVVDTGRTYNGTLNSNQVSKANLMAIGVKAGVMLDFRHLFHLKSSSKF